MTDLAHVSTAALTAELAHRRPAPTVEAAECCTRSSCCHATRDEHGTLMGHDAPLPPNTDRVED